MIRYPHVYCNLLEKSDAPKLEEGLKLLEKHLGVNLKEYFAVVFQTFSWFIESNYARDCGETVDEGFRSSDTNTFFFSKDNFPSGGMLISLIERMSIDAVGMQQHLLEAADEDQKKERSFDPFFARSLKYFQHPIAKVGEGKFCILDFKFMIEGLCTGLSWRVQPLLEENALNDSERKKVLGTLRSEYGSLVEPYFLEVLRKIFGEITESLQGQQKKPDAIVKGNGITLLFEFTVEYYTIESLYSTNTARLFECLDRLLFNTTKNPGKMKNLDNYIQSELKENSESTLLPILVTERYLGNPELLKKAGYDLEHKIKEKQWDGLITCPLIISLDELEQFWMFADNDKDEAIVQFADLAQKWLSEEGKIAYGYSFGKFLIKHVRTDTRNQAYDEFFNNSALLADVAKILKPSTQPLPAEAGSG